MRPLAALIAPVAAAALFAACGDNLPGPIAIADYPAAVRDAVCQAAVRCGEVEDLAVCHETNIGLTIAFTPSELAAVTTGKIAYRGDFARSCVDGLAGRSCDTTSATGRRAPADCQALLAGQLHGGESCAFDEECISQRCAEAPCGMACCTGTCDGDAPPSPAQLGQACGGAAGIACATGLRCDGASGTCAALQGSGGACAVADDCADGLVCVGQACAALPGLGAACSFGCRDAGATCSSASHTCVAVGLLGAACTLGGRPSECSPFYVCDRTEHCSPGVGLGQPCSLGDQCADDQAECDVLVGDDTSTCTLPKPDGAACGRDRGCASLYCSPFTLQCADAPVCL